MGLTFDKLKRFDQTLSSLGTLMIASRGGKSIAISMEDLAAQIDNELSFIGSAAYCQSSDFALSSHDHDIYTSAWYENHIVGQSDKIHNILSIDDITHDKNVVLKISGDANSHQEEIDAIKADILSTYAPKAGQIMLQTFSSKEQADDVIDANPSSPAFSGWVRTGQQYTASIFQLSDQLTTIFEFSDGLITIPNLSSFCRMRCDVDASNCGQFNKGYTCLPKHTHPVQLDANSMVDLNNVDLVDPLPSAYIPIGESVGSPIVKYLSAGQSVNDSSSDTYIKLFHNGDAKKEKQRFDVADIMAGTVDMKSDEWFEMPIQCQTETFKEMFHNLNLATTYSENNSEVAYPSHNEVVAYVYVGFTSFTKN